MELKHLLSYATVVRLGSFSRAAEELYIAQPTISLHVRQLEEELEDKVAVRHYYHADSTEETEKLLEEAVSETVQKRDYLIHAGCYLVLSALSLWSFGRASRPWRSRFFAATACALYGLVLEFLQMLPIVGRSCSAQDILDNCLGAVVGALLLPVSLYPDSKGESPHER